MVTSKLVPAFLAAYAFMFRKVVSRIWDTLLLVVGVLLVMLPISPWNMVNPRRDSGVFLYIGWRILQGELPYRDIWDHKPPVIFYINALGVALSGHSRWGIWCLEVLFVFCAAWLGFRLVRKVFGGGTAAAISFLWLLTLVFVIQGGNLTTEYTLLFQFALLAVVCHAEEKPSPWLWFLTGVLIALSFFTKQNTIGIGIAVLLYLGISRLRSQQHRKLWQEVSWIALGSGIVSLAIVLFFAAQDALDDFWSAAFQYNFVYVSSSVNIKARLKNLLGGLEPLTITSLFPLALLGYLTGLFSLKYGLFKTEKQRVLISIGALAFPMELVLVSLTDHPYPHYYMALLPVLAILAGVVFWSLFSTLERKAVPTIARHLFATGILLFLAGNMYIPYRKQVAEFRNTELLQATIYLQANTAPDDFVLFWGAETANNFLAQRRSPSRFVYQYPLYTPGYTTPQMVEELLDDLVRTHPIIINTPNKRTPMYQFPVTSEKIQADIAFLQAHYCPVDQIGSYVVYRYSDTTCPSQE